MTAYSIKDLENLSGIKAHTLRIWEKRYAIFNPQRTDTNIRYFTEDDVQKILHITLLNRKGYKISKIAKMSTSEIVRQVAKYSDVNENFENEIDGLMMAVFELDATKFNLILDNQISANGLELAIESVFYPLLDKLSMMWIAGSVKTVHESFVTNAIKRKLIHQIENIKVKDYRQDIKFIIYLPEQETHELSALFAEYILVKNNIKVINLGTNISLIEILEASYIYSATHIFTIFNDSFAETPLMPYIEELSKNLDNVDILISGFQVKNQQLSQLPSVKIVDDLEHFKLILKLDE
jgi:MerR family transcriptional regulator, light-induced transcriptional regulator